MTTLDRAQDQTSSADQTGQGLRLAQITGVLGVVYGDIGTSPLYVLRASLRQTAGGTPVPEDILGVLSLVFWSLILVVTVKYVSVVMRADNKGEGGVLAMMALAVRHLPEGRIKRLATLTGIFGACLFFGDGTITPAISVLSAVEGLATVEQGFDSFVLPIAVTILIALFYMQSIGTEKVGRLFGPIMAVYFVVLAVMGVSHIIQRPDILFALNPLYAVRFAMNDGGLAFLALGSVVLAVTGAEALYADMGHFGKRAIRIAWFALVLPALLLNYFGQGALLLDDATAIDSPFYRLVPEAARLPVLVLATLAAIIASQAVISGAFSVTRQAIQLGLLPRMHIIHTSAKEIGQISGDIKVEDVVKNDLVDVANSFDAAKVKADAEGFALSDDYKKVDVEAIKAAL